ncbi:polysaccharide biosynthesis tyrosine autokinase [Geminocystis sp. NIES-3708]|uniref:polysaccharide biosynthesis tyrosine autokinase n=1 Tax=Geminocystis sp. NIES-3708 TaxID=1615909 RepID=UPI00082B230F|nr:tyrosine-protein kinase domain-containing protein [Geminocystis sp. NIES-3708]
MIYEIDKFSGEELENVNQTSAINQRNKLRFYLNILKRKWLIIVGFIMIGFFPAFAISSRDPITYSGNFEMLVEPATSADKITDASTLARTGGNVDERLLSIDYPTILRILKSREILNDIATNISNRYSNIPKDFLLDSFNDSLIVEQAKEGQKNRLDTTKIITVRYKSLDPDFVLLVLNTIADKYLEYSKTEREKSLDSGVKFINEQLPKIKNRINNLQNQQQKLQLENQLVNPAVKGDSLFQINTASNQELLTLESQLKELNVLSNNLQKDLGLSVEESLIASTLSQEPKRQQLLIQLQQIESQIALESAKLTSNHPTLLNLKEQRDNISNLVNQETTKILNQNNINPNINPRVFAFQDNNRLNLIQKLIETQNQIDTLSSRYQSLSQNQIQTGNNLEIIPDVIKKYNELERQISLDTAILNQLTAQRETLAVEIAQKQIPWQLLSKPQIPIDEYGNIKGAKSDPTKKISFGIGTGLILGIIAAIAIEKKRDIFYEESDLKYYFGLPILGKILLDPEGKKKSNLEEGNFFEESSRVHKTIPPSQVSLSEIYTNIYFQLPHNNKNYLLISSLNPDDGQAYIAANLAKTAAKLDEKVLLIDTNIIQPEIQEYFDQPIRKGLTDLLQFPIIQDSIITEIGCEQNVSILTVGTNDADLPFSIGGEETQSLIHSISEDYTLILYNSSFFLQSYDLSLLAEKTQGIVFVVKLKETSHSLLTEAIQRIQTYNLNFLGFVIVE